MLLNPASDASRLNDRGCTHSGQRGLATRDDKHCKSLRYLTAILADAICIGRNRHNFPCGLLAGGAMLLMHRGGVPGRQLA